MSIIGRSQSPGMPARPAIAAIMATAAMACAFFAPGCVSSDTAVAPTTDMPTAGDAAPSAPAPRPLRLLFFGKQTEWFHTSNPIADQVLSDRARGWGWETTSTKDAAAFTADGLAKFDVVVFLLSSGTVLDEAQRDAFHAYIANGGGWAGVHSASHTDYDSTWQIGLVGSTFRGHPPIQAGAVDRVDESDSITAHLPKKWTRTDEWYTFLTRPELNPRVKVLLAFDETANPDYPGPG